MSDSAMPIAPAGLLAWTAESRLAARPAAMARARAAMHAAAGVVVPARVPVRRRFGVALPGLDGLGRHPIRLTAGSIAAVVALLVSVGWDAGPGSPLHSIQLARQDASLVLASRAQGVDLRLGYAEARLRAAATGHDRHDNLAEAASLLTAAQPNLPANHGDPLWLRWSQDEAELTTGQSGGESGSNPRLGDGGRDGAPPGSAPSPSGDDHGGDGAGPTPSGDGGGGGGG